MLQFVSRAQVICIRVSLMGGGHDLNCLHRDPVDEDSGVLKLVGNETQVSCIGIWLLRRLVLCCSSWKYLECVD